MSTINISKPKKEKNSGFMPFIKIVLILFVIIFALKYLIDFIIG